MNIIEFSKENPQIGLFMRNGISGPEKNLVDSFVNYIPQCFRWQKGAVALFYEPRIETWFPDLVAIQYLPEIFDSWVETRNLLRPMDLKVLHYLSNIKKADLITLIKNLGISSRMLLNTIERLLDAKLIKSLKENYKIESLNRIFALRSIISIEAKIKNWTEAFHQSQLNKWFASESYVLSPVENPNQSIVERSENIGVGVFLLNGKNIRKIQNAKRNNIPSSYGSWMFNEWIGRYIQSMNR